MHESLGERIAFGVISAVIAGVGALVVEVLDYWFWDIGWVEAESIGEYIRQVWFIPVGIAVIAFGMGIWKGSYTIDFAKSIWSDIW